jgi:DNA-directed RNA polymerase subunit L
MMIPSKSTLENAWEVKIGGDCYTVGKILEWMMYVMFYLPKEWGGKGAGNSILSFCAFRKSHPHDDEANLILAFTEEADKGVVRDYLNQGLKEARRIVSEMAVLF